MKLDVINEDEYLKFALKHEYISIYQLPAWGKLKKTTGWITHLLGLYDKNKLIGVTMILEKKLPIKKSLFYSPRGLLMDVSNKEILSFFTTEIKKYMKKHNAFMLKVDPNVIYALYDQNKENKIIKGDKIFNNFIELGYKHLGFTLNFETMQPRFLCRFKLKDTYDETLKSFSKSTVKNIDKTYKMGVVVKEVNTDDIDLFTSLLKETGRNKNFVVRPSSYYKQMVLLMPEYIKLYIAYIDVNLYYKNLSFEKNNLNKELDNIKELMNKCNVGKKLNKKYEELNNKINNVIKQMEDVKNIRKSNDFIPIGALMSIFIGNEGITFTSGTNNIYKSFNPKYAYYNKHIQDCFKYNKEYCNFYGISGNVDKNSEYYSIYEIKKGFNVEIVELIGEFDLITNKFYYYLYKLALVGYKMLKKVKK